MPKIYEVTLVIMVFNYRKHRVFVRICLPTVIDLRQVVGQLCNPVLIWPSVFFVIFKMHRLIFRSKIKLTLIVMMSNVP